jgi:hypothetical protein
MKTYVLTIFVSIYATCFKYSQTVIPFVAEEIKGVEIYQKYPNINFSSLKIDGYDSGKVELYEYRNTKLHLLAYKYDSIDLKSNSITSSGIRYHYFIHSKDSIFGYDIDEYKKPSIRRLKVDSLLKQEWATQVNLFSMMTFNIPKLTSVKKYNDTIQEEYSFSNTDTSIHGSFRFRYSSKMNNIPYSLSKEIDSIKGMKLFEAKLVFDPRYLTIEKIALEKMEKEYSFKEITFIRPEIIKHIDMYLKKEK